VKYISTSVTKSQYQFTQESPRYYCKSVSKRVAAKERRGLDYLPKCRNARCSGECNFNCVHKENTCVARNLHDLCGEYNTFRGNLTLPKDATPADHRRAKKSFGERMDDWSRANGYIFAFRAILHATNRTNAHWDFQLFTDAPAKPFRAFWREAWVKSGGRRATIVGTTDEELDATAKYQSKVDSAKQRAGSVEYSKTNIEDNLDPPTEPKEPYFLLKSRSELGLERVWTKGDFWQGGSLDKVWKILIDEWYAKPDEDDLLARAMSRDKYGKPPKPVRQPDPEPLPAVYEPGKNLRHDAWVFAERMPTTPETAVGANDLAARWGVDGAYMLRCFKILPGAIRLDGDLVDGRLISNAWYLDRSAVSPQT
jgi:hypothetical protein